MILIVVRTKTGPELVNFENVTYTDTSRNNITLHFGGERNCLTIQMSTEELIHEVLSAINRTEMPLYYHKNILIKQLKGTNEDQY